MAKVTIVVPVYNVEKYVKKCLDTLKKQSLEDIEILIVNDGSKDSSVSICEEMVKEDPRMRIIHKENGGLMSAWIAGVKEASADYIGFVDSDDWVDNDYFEFLYNKIIETQADVVIGKYCEDDTKEQIEFLRSEDHIYEGENEIQNLIKDYLNGIFVKDHPVSYCRWDKMYRKEVILNAIEDLDISISLGEDVNTNMAVWPRCRKVCSYSKAPFYHYRKNDSSISNTYKEKQIDNIHRLYGALIKICEKHRLDFLNMKIFIGNMVFEEINKALLLSEDRKVRNQRVHYILRDENMVECLKRFCRKKGWLYMGYYFLFRIGLVEVGYFIRKHY